MVAPRGKLTYLLPILWLLLVCTCKPLCAAAQAADVDISFEFDSGEGFHGSPLIELHHSSSDGTLKISSGDSFVIDSPRIHLPLTDGRHSIAMRYRSMLSSAKSQGSFRLGVISDDGEAESSTTSIIDVPFPIAGDGKWKTVHLPIDAKSGNMTLVGLSLEATANGAFHIDFLRIARRPLILRVSGCNGEIYSDSSSFVEREYPIATHQIQANDALFAERTTWLHRNSSLEFGQTFNCLRSGGETITLEGEQFGQGGVIGIGVPARVFIGGKPCVNVTHDVNHPQQILTCISPPMDQDLQKSMGPLISPQSMVEVRNGALPGLTDGKPYFTYAKAPPSPSYVTTSNAASHAIDVAWAPGGDEWSQNLFTIGYVLRYSRATRSSPSDWNEMIVGNITKTTIRGLEPNSLYYVSLAALSGDQEREGWWKNLDFYGRVQDNSILSAEISRALEGLNTTVTAHTLADDISFESFDANLTQSHGPIDSSSSIGPSGVEDGEGHYGLALIGDAAILNCNSSSFCCDDYDPMLEGCNPETLTCRSAPYRESDDNRFIFERFNETNIADISAACGPALRLTGASDRLRGAAWYRRPQDVAEGFATAFRYRITEPSTRHCVSRGADGFAFVIQGQGTGALGDGGLGLGYAGIENSLAIEFDTFFNHEVLDPFSSHVSIHTRGWRAPNDSNHSYSLGHTTAVPDLASGEIDVKIDYIPRFDIDSLTQPSYVASSHLASFFENGNNPTGGLGDWGGNGLGMLRVFCSNLREAALTVPLDLASTLKLNGGRAYVGFTAATGRESWQAHDILNWNFSSYRMDSEYFEPVMVNGIGAHSA